MELLIKNSRVVDSTQDFIGDVYIKDGVIEKLGKNLQIDCETLSGEGLVLLPSFIDLHSHFRDPGLTYKEDLFTGSMAALRGGYTAVNLMANTNPVCSNLDVIKYVLKKAEEINLIDIYQTISITNNFDGKSLSDFDEVPWNVRFTSDDGNGIKNNNTMLEAMIKARKYNLRLMSHAEDEDIVKYNTRLSENLMTIRDIELAKATKVHLHMAHVSTKEAMKEIIRAKQKGYNITCEVTPHHLGLCNETEYLVNPPLREIGDVEYLIESLRDGWIDAIATDHAPHSLEDKVGGAPGISGLETAFSVCYSQLVKGRHITLNRLSQVMSENPGRLLDIKKGQIKIGYDGDLVLVNLEKKHMISTDEFLSKGKNTPFEGMEFWGIVQKTIKAGRVLYSKEGETNDYR